MRPSRFYRPTTPDPLEGRVVLSAAAGDLAQLVAQGQTFGQGFTPATLSAAEIARSDASDASFATTPSQTLRDGLPVAYQETTDYAVGTPQTESIVEIPNLANDSVTTDKTIRLHDNGGTETVVQTETYAGGSSPLSGPDKTYTITTTLPDGTTQTETENVVTSGHKTVSNATIHESAGVETWTSVSLKRGTTTTTRRTIIEPYGTIEHQETVSTAYGKLDSTTKTTTTFPGEIQVSQYATNVIRVKPTSS